MRTDQELAAYIGLDWAINAVQMQPATGGPVEPVGGEFVGIRDIVRSSGPVSRESLRSSRDGMSKACS